MAAIILAGIKKKIVSIFERILSHTNAYIDLCDLKKNINRVAVLNYEMMPLILPLEEKSGKIISEINPGGIVNNMSLQISKDDLMFQFWLYHTGSVDAALRGYFSIGYQQAAIVKEILKKNFNDITKLDVLDFASGHGRVSRYFKDFLPIHNITIAEIKQQAVNFQKDVFGYKGFVSSANPIELCCTEKFDFILISSLFTHLNKPLFASWLKKIGSMLKENGVLSLSLHILSVNDETVFNYSERSEEDMFRETSENLAGKNIYGLTSLNRVAFRELVFTNLGINFQVIEEREWGDSQVLMSIKSMPEN